MLPPRRHQQQEEGVDSWLMSYADMITLLMCFFVIFASVSEPKKEKLSALTEGVSGRFGTVELATPFEGVFRSLQAVVENHQILKDVAIEKGEKTLTMELSSNTFFRNKTAEFEERMVPVMNELADTLNSIQFMDYQIIVEGHTNDIPISTAYFPSNWELSTSRSAKMVRFFIQKGIKPERLRAIGYGDTRPRVPNLDGNGNAIIENRKLNERMIIRVEQVL